MVRIKWFMSSCGQARGIDQPSLVNEKKTVFQVLGSYGHLKATRAWDRVEQLFLHRRRHWNGTSVKSHTLLPEHRHKVPMRDGVSHGLHERLQSVKSGQTRCCPVFSFQQKPFQITCDLLAMVLPSKILSSVFLGWPPAKTAIFSCNSGKRPHTCLSWL